MIYYLPTKIYEEKNCVAIHGEELAELGHHALLVTGRSSARLCGALKDVEKALDAHGVAHTLFDGVEANPSVETVMKACAVGLACGADFVIGIGGGSPMDAAKAIALMMAHPHDGADLLYRVVPGIQALPVVAVPTTCGTGSEATGAAVLTLHSKRTKSGMSNKIFPTLSLVDEAYLAFAPRSVVRATAMDALGHLIESYLNSKATEYSRMFVAQGLKLWSRSKEVLLGSGELSAAERRDLMNASTLAGMAIAHTGTSLPHGLSYRVTYELGIPHGKAIGYFLAGYLREAQREDREYLLTLAGFHSLDDFEEFYACLCGGDAPRRDCLEQSMEEVLANPARLKSAPFPVDRQVLQRIVFGTSGNN